MEKMELGDTKNDGRKNGKKFTNELSRPKKNSAVLKDQLVLHVLSLDRDMQKNKLLMNIYKKGRG